MLTDLRRIRLRPEGAPGLEFAGTFLRRPIGQPGNDSSAQPFVAITRNVLVRPVHRGSRAYMGVISGCQT